MGQTETHRDHWCQTIKAEEKTKFETHPVATSRLNFLQFFVEKRLELIRRPYSVTLDFERSAFMLDSTV